MSEYKIEKCIETLKKFGFNVFGEDIQKDEIDNNPSFFIFHDDGDLSKTENGKYYKEVTVMFFTRDDTVCPDEFDLISAMRKCSLFFDRTDNDIGKMAGSETYAKTKTFTFHRVIRADC